MPEDDVYEPMGEHGVRIMALENRLGTLETTCQQIQSTLQTMTLQALSTVSEAVTEAANVAESVAETIVEEAMTEQAPETNNSDKPVEVVVVSEGEESETNSENSSGETQKRRPKTRFW